MDDDGSEAAEDEEEGAARERACCRRSCSSSAGRLEEVAAEKELEPAEDAVEECRSCKVSLKRRGEGERLR